MNQPPGRCGARARDGGYCERYPVEGSNRCPNHGGHSTGPPKGSANHLQHGATASPLNLINHLSDDELQWVQALVDAYLQEANFDASSPKVERLTRTCVMIFQEWKAEEQVLQEGMGKDTVVGVNSNGEPVVNTNSENYLNRRMDRLNDKIRMNLDALGLTGKQQQGRPSQDELSSDSYTIILEEDEDGDHWSTGNADADADADADDENDEDSSSEDDDR